MLIAFVLRKNQCIMLKDFCDNKIRHILLWLVKNTKQIHKKELLVLLINTSWIPLHWRVCCSIIMWDEMIPFVFQAKFLQEIFLKSLKLFFSFLKLSHTFILILYSYLSWLKECFYCDTVVSIRILSILKLFHNILKTFINCNYMLEWIYPQNILNIQWQVKLNIFYDISNIFQIKTIEICG